MPPVPHPDCFLAISCTCVGVGPGGTTSMLARVAIVNYLGERVIDSYVMPTMVVEDRREATTGITDQHLYSSKAVPFNIIQQQVANTIKGKVLVGHSLWNDLSVLGIPHPASDTRDVALYLPFRNALRSPHQIIGLQTLMWHLMCRRVQDGQQHPLENARAVIDLYRSRAQEWEGAIGKDVWPCAFAPESFSRCYR